FCLQTKSMAHQKHRRMAIKREKIVYQIADIRPDFSARLRNKSCEFGYARILHFHKIPHCHISNHSLPDCLTSSRFLSTMSTSCIAVQLPVDSRLGDRLSSEHTATRHSHTCNYLALSLGVHSRVVL